MKRAISALILAGLGLVACAGETGAESGGSTGAPPATEAACAAAGGRWAPGGIRAQEICFLPTPDAGATCETNDDCTGFCLAETRSCTAETPVFGCFEQIVPGGARVTLCID